IYTLSLHDALPICLRLPGRREDQHRPARDLPDLVPRRRLPVLRARAANLGAQPDRGSEPGRRDHDGGAVDRARDRLRHPLRADAAAVGGGGAAARALRGSRPGGMTRALLERLGVELPIVQAGMGGGIAGSELAAAVSEAGGLGTIGNMPAPALANELAKAKQASAKPIAVNLLLNLARASHWEAAGQADVIVTFWGSPRRRSEKPWLHQCGSVDEAQAARAAGADGVIVQGVEAGGHVRGTTPALELLRQVRAALPDGYPLLLAGGIADPADVRRALDAGAEAAVLGTRFLMSEESRARRAYKQRLMESRETVLTELFGLGWPDAPHRVIWNEAAERWLRKDRRGPRWVRAAN